MAIVKFGRAEDLATLQASARNIFSPMSFSFRDESIPDVCPLTSGEKALKAELEAVVKAGLEEFLRVGNALAELRNRRLYRVEFATFEEYVRVKFALARSSADSLIRSAQTAEVLLEAGIELPPNTTATLMKPIASLPGEELQVACWQFAQSLAPARGVTEPLMSRLVRVVRNALDGVDEETDDSKPNVYPDGYHKGRRKRWLTSPERERPFIRPIERLAAWEGFNVEVIVSTVSPPSALTVYKACETLTDRCRLVQERLLSCYPELSGASLRNGQTPEPDRTTRDS